jgi:hypothetical protein
MIPRLTRLYDVGRGAGSVMVGTVASLLMADRPHGSGMPEKGTPEYDWLYGGTAQSPSGDATQQVPVTSAQRPDETRVMPATRPDARG